MRTRLIVPALLVLVLLTACGGGGKKAAQTTTSSSTTSTTVAATSSTTSSTSSSTTSSTTTTSAATSTTAPGTTTTSLTSTATTTAGAAGAVTSEDQLLNAIQTEGLTPQRAEELFVLDVGPLPGVSVAGIKPDGGFDGTTAVMDLYAEWGHLSAAQRAAATALLKPAKVETGSLPAQAATSTSAGAGATTTTGNGAPATTGNGSPATTAAAPGATTTSTAVLKAATWPVPRAGARPQRGGSVPLRYELAGYSEPDYMAMALNADATEAVDLHASPYEMFDIEISNDMTKAYAETSIWDVTTLPVTHKVIAQRWPGNACHIIVYAAKFDGLSKDDAAAIMAHEVFHCYQQRQAGTYENALNLGSHAWVAEGEATWVMLQLYPGAQVVGETTSSVISDIWSKYANTPTTKYCDRSYDALGVFGHEGDLSSQSSVWDALLPMVSAVVGSGNGELAPGECSDISALKILMGAGSDRYYSTWGPSYYEDQSHPDWHMAGPGSPPKSGPSPDQVTINAGDAHEIGLLPSFQAHQTKIDSNADILAIILPSGYGEVHDEGYTVEKTLDNVAPLVLCLKQGGCKCPDGSPGASEISIPAHAPVYVGLDGGDTQLAAYAAGDSLKKYCKDPTPPPPPGGGPPGGPGGGGGGGGGEPENPVPPGLSWGDPHLETLDGLHYDLQAAGEFTLLKSAGGGFDVQVRQIPAPGSRFVAYNEAVAAKVGSHRVVIGLDNGLIVAHIDGARDNYEYTRVGPGILENRFDAAGGGFLLEWPDGTTLWAHQFTQYGLNIQVVLAPDLQGKVEGLLAGSGLGTKPGFVTSSGKDLGPTVPPAVLYGKFASSWRITQAESLFDYAPGQSTKTFIVPGFPYRFIGPFQLPNHAQLEAQCRAAGVTDPYLLQDCIIDHSATPSPAVLDSYAQAQVVQTVRQNLAHHLPVFGPGPATPTTTTTVPASTTTTTSVSGAERTLVVAGTVSAKSETPTFSFPANAGDILWFGPTSNKRLDGVSCVDGSQFLYSLVSPSGQVLNSADLPPNTFTQSLCGDAERFVLPETGTYKIVANVNKAATGTYNFSFEFEQPDVDRGAIQAGQTVSGTVPDAASHVIYHLRLNANEFVQISGPGCFVTTPPQSSGMGVAVVPLVHGKPDLAIGAGVQDCSSQADPLLGFMNSAGTGYTGSFSSELVVNWYNWGPGRYQFTLRTCSGSQIKFTSTGRSCPAVASPAPAATTTTALSSTSRSLVVNGVVSNQTETPSFTFSAKANDIIWFGRGVNCPDNMLYALVDPAGKTLNQADFQGFSGITLCSGGERFVLPATGTYKVVANATKAATGTYSFSFEFEKPDIDHGNVGLNQVLSGYIPDAATHALYYFKSAGRRVLQISGPGCELAQAPVRGSPGMSVDVIALNYHQGGTPGVKAHTGPVAMGEVDCYSGYIYLNQGGSYQLVVNQYNHGPGAYRFRLRECTYAAAQANRGGGCPLPRH